MTTVRLTERFSLQIVRSQPIDGGPVIQRTILETDRNWGNGTDPDEFEEVFDDTRELPADAFDNLDLNNLSQLDEDGNAVRTCAFTKIKYIRLENLSSGGHVLIGGGTDNAGAANAWIGGPFTGDADMAKVEDGDSYEWTSRAGVAVTNLTSDVLAIGGYTAGQTYRLVLAGDIT